MKTATIIFLVLSILEVLALGLFPSCAVAFGFADISDFYIEEATMGDVYLDLGLSVLAAIASIVSLVRLIKAKDAVKFKNWILYIATFVGVFYMGFLSFTLVAYVLAYFLQDKHFGIAKPATATASSTDTDAYQKLMQIKSLYESGAISEEEYLAEKAKILG
ncbi:MAG: SHOCT domain-containing protein [Clostridia bacterium]|nr:SHOCT domain-containing protein [Clostridia bacterium]